MKRLYFPRFFFLSNDELLEILSETKDPTRVQPHLGKCFDGIGKLVFEENNIISGMYSAEGEKVSFGGETITPSAMVEQWLTQVEDKMFKSMARVMRRPDSRQGPRLWMQDWPGQVVIGIAGGRTAEVEKGFAAGAPRAWPTTASASGSTSRRRSSWCAATSRSSRARWSRRSS